jgi:uncharacterized protein with ATP-grasp and redox domains
MKTDPECLVCFVKQAALAAQRVTADPDRVFAAVQETSKILPSLSRDLAPGENATRVLRTVTAYLGIEDPYRAEKARYNALALEAYDALKATIASSPDPLEAAVRVAAVGNVLDLNIFEHVDVATLADEARAMTWAIHDFSAFKRDVSTARRILYLGDNAGEIAFDRLLVEALPPDSVTFAVKSGPVANDVLLDDARQVGMDRVARVIETGSAFFGAPLSRCSPAFHAEFDAADMIIAKGMGNFETLGDVDANIYFILKVKCDVVARAIGVRSGDLVLLAQRHRLHAGASAGL